LEQAGPEYAFGEDSTWVLPLDSLRACAGDVDNPMAELVFSITGNKHVTGMLDSQHDAIVFTAELNWNGVEELYFVVADKNGLKTSLKSRIACGRFPTPPAV